MKILITGSTGLLGQALCRRLAPCHEVVGISRHATPHQERWQHLACDLTEAQTTARMVQQVGPDVVIHTQALSDVDRCQEEPDEARRSNVETSTHLCRALGGSRPLLLALSTDYVFDGLKGQPYDEEDVPRPVSVYGKSKLESEQVVLRYPQGVVIRPSTLFGPARTNFCERIVHQARQGRTIDAFVDQTTSPTYTEDLAGGIEALMQALVAGGLSGAPRIYHITNREHCTRVEFAARVVELLGCQGSLVRAVLMEDQHRPAPRPPFSALVSRHLRDVIGQELPPWHEALNAYLISQGWRN